MGRLREERERKSSAGGLGEQGDCEKNHGNDCRNLGSEHKELKLAGGGVVVVFVSGSSHRILGRKVAKSEEWRT